jgi:hypothetical protein
MRHPAAHPPAIAGASQQASQARKKSDFRIDLCALHSRWSQLSPPTLDQQKQRLAEQEERLQKLEALLARQAEAPKP